MNPSKILKSTFFLFRISLISKQINRMQTPGGSQSQMRKRFSKLNYLSRDKQQRISISLGKKKRMRLMKSLKVMWLRNSKKR